MSGPSGGLRRSIGICPKRVEAAIESVVTWFSIASVALMSPHVAALTDARGIFRKSNQSSGVAAVIRVRLLGSFIREDVVPCGNLDVSLKIFYYLRK
jgi:hypothetical protein